MDLARLIYLGDLRLTVTLAAAVMIWLLAARHYRSACYWCLTIACVYGTIALSKIIYLGWGLHSTILDFKAASGHAAGAAAVLPVALYLAAASSDRRKQNIAFLVGWIVSVAVAISLVRQGEHTTSEAFAGWCLGASASAAAWMSMRHKLILPSRAIVAAAITMTAVVFLFIQAVPVNWWMIKTALVLSGSQRVHSWNDC